MIERDALYARVRRMLAEITWIHSVTQLDELAKQKAVEAEIQGFVTEVLEAQ